MKRVLNVLLIGIISVMPAYAAIPVTGTGESLRFNTSGFSSELKPGYELFEKKCTHCHSQKRVVTALMNGVSEYTFLPFDLNYMRASVFNMVRKSKAHPDSTISKEDAKTIMLFLESMLKQATR